ncbi:MAG TPA: alpha/beta hydrolase [Chloroflexia bacterium]|nr:alpha/beta hydrolase [Chloroflexia bacterium]
MDCSGGIEPSEKQVEAGGLNWNYFEWNPEGKFNILLVHGVTSDAHAWWRIAPALAREGARVIAVDMPGHGKTSESPDDTLWATTAHQLAAFVVATGLNKSSYSLCGHSWGGVVCLLLAVEYPEGLQRLALLDPAIYLSENRSAAMGAEYGEMVNQPKLSHAEYLAWARENMPTWQDCDYYWKAGAMVAFKPATVRDFYQHNSGQNVTTQLNKVKIPLLLVISDEQVGGILPLEVQSAAIAALRPGLGQAVRLSGVGHNLFREDYAATMQVLKPFLLGNEG